MPTYDYFCRGCKYEEIILVKTSEVVVDCPHCKTPLERRLSAPDIHNSNKTASTERDYRIMIKDLPNGEKKIVYEGSLSEALGMRDTENLLIIGRTRNLMSPQEKEVEAERVAGEIIESLG